MVRIRLFAALREAAGVPEVEAPAAPLQAILDELGERFGERFAAVLGYSSVLVDGERWRGPAAPVPDGAELALLPPFSGGPSSGGWTPPARGMGLMRKLLVAVVVLLLLGAVADFAAARVFEDRVTEALQREYDLGQRPVVQVRDFPFLPHLATGRFSTIDVAATDASARGINAAQLELTLHGVRVPREVLLGEPGQVTVDRADGTIELTEAEVNRLLADRLRGGELAIEEDGVEVRQVELLGTAGTCWSPASWGPATAASPSPPTTSGWAVAGPLDPSLQDCSLSQFTFQVPLPELPAGVRLERVDTRPGTVVLTAGAAGSGWTPDTLIP